VENHFLLTLFSYPLRWEELALFISVGGVLWCGGEELILPLYVTWGGITRGC